VNIADADWKFVDRARGWTLQGEGGKPIPIGVQKLGNTKSLELDLSQAVKPGKYTLLANWDWDRFTVNGNIDVRPLSDFSTARPAAFSQDLLVAKTGKVPVTLEGSDFEFVTKVEIEKVNDKFASPSPVPFILSKGLRQGPQDRMDIQVNTIDLDAGEYKLLISQLDGGIRPMPLKILPAPPVIDNLPVVVNQRGSSVTFRLKGQRLELLTRLEVARGKATLGPPCPNQSARELNINMEDDIAVGTSLAVRAYIKDRSEPWVFSDAVRIAGSRPNITEVRLSQPPDQDVQLERGELAWGTYLSAMIRVEHLQSNSVVKLTCEQPGGAAVTLRLGERSGALSLQQLAPDQMFLSFDTSAWLNGCLLRAAVANGSEGESDVYALGRIVRVPKIERFEPAATDSGTSGSYATLTGQNLETIEKIGWSPDRGELITGLPLPIAGDATKQSMRVLLPLPPPGTNSALYVWLRGESQARLARVHVQ
jgi:hypothetical protein